MLKEIVANTCKRKVIKKSQGLYQPKFKDTFWMTGYTLFVLAKPCDAIGFARRLFTEDVVVGIWP